MDKKKPIKRKKSHDSEENDKTKIKKENEENEKLKKIFPEANINT